MVSLGGMSPGGSVALGIIVGLLSTSVQSLGLTLQRKSHILEDEKDPCDVRRPPHRRRRWQLGMGMFIIANILGSSVQISTLPLPVLSTLQASGLVFNSICATLILGEPFTRWSMCGTVLVCTGALLIAVFGAFPAPAHTLTELLVLLGRRSFVIWMIFQGLVVVSMGVTTELLAYLSPHSQSSPRLRLVRGLSYGCISGILSAHSLLVAKSAVELIIKTVSDGDNQFIHWQSWMLVLALITLALSQLHYLHRGLKLVSTSVLYPLVFCIYNIIAILDGLIYFRQTDLITPLRGCLIALGTGILLSGVLALSWRLSDEQHPPAVGQSSLAPGLGLVEDTEGEDESVAGSETLLDDDDGSPVSYQTFTPQGSDNLGLGQNLRLSERTEIWDELDDRQELASTAKNRRRSTSFPAFGESSALSSSSRVVSAGSGGAVSVSSGPSPGPEHGLRRISRRRRKSTGFPGFRARGSSKTRGLQGALGGMFKMKWWQGARNGCSPSPPNIDSEEAGLLSHRRDGEEGPADHHVGGGGGRSRRPDGLAI